MSHVEVGIIIFRAQLKWNLLTDLSAMLVSEIPSRWEGSSVSTIISV
jgi:hypothetical protein